MDVHDLPHAAVRLGLLQLRVVGAMNLADTLGWVAAGFVIGGGCLSISTVFRPAPEQDHIADGLYAVGLWIGFIANVIDTSPVWAAVYGLGAAYYTWRWWKNRRNGRMRKALRELGAKSRAKVQVLVDRITRSPAPAPSGGAS